MDFLELLKLEFLENTVQNYLFFVLLILLALLFKNSVARYLCGSIYRLVGFATKEISREDSDLKLQRPIRLFVFWIALFVGFQQLQFPRFLDLADAEEFGLRMVLNKGYVLLIAYLFFWFLIRLVDVIGEVMILRAAKTANKMDDQIVPFAVEIVKVIVVILGSLTVLSSVFDLNIAALATGLGIGGIAIAMASKESLESLLGSFTIFLDKPFTYGDIVTVNGYTGTVEKVGFRSTRIRTFDKSVVTVPNKNMVNAELDNLGVRPIRRVKFTLGLLYSTSVEQMKDIISAMEKMINEHPKTTENGARVRFLSFGSSSLDLLVLYYVDSPDWEILIDTQQEINFNIIALVQEKGSDFAYPTTTVHLEK